MAKRSKLTTVTTVLFAAAIFIWSCGGGEAPKENAGEKTTTTETPAPEKYDPKRGEGKFDENNVKLGPLDKALAEKGKTVASTKCFSCHKLTDEKLVGPGWKGVTKKHKAHWIMNFITNPDPMIDKDPELQAQLEVCLLRMPNQNLTDEEARNIVEFMRQNDGEK